MRKRSILALLRNVECAAVHSNAASAIWAIFLWHSHLTVIWKVLPCDSRAGDSPETHGTLHHQGTVPAGNCRYSKNLADSDAYVRVFVRV